MPHNSMSLKPNARIRVRGAALFGRHRVDLARTIDRLPNGGECARLAWWPRGSGLRSCQPIEVISDRLMPSLQQRCA